MTDSTDPGAVTHDNDECHYYAYCSGQCSEHGFQLGKPCAKRTELESALTAMTARAEAAEAELAKLSTKVGAVRDALGAFDGAASYTYRQELRFPLMLTVRALFEPAAKPHGIDLATYLTAEAEREDGAGDPPPEPAPWTPQPGDRVRNYLVSTDLGVVQQCEPGFEQFGAPVIWDKSPGQVFYVPISQLVRVIEPPKPASAGFAEEPRCDWCECRLGGVFWSDAPESSKKLFCTEVCREACRKNGWRRAGEPEPAPQPDAAPKVLPVEEWRREIVEALRESASQPLVFGAMLRDMADRLERGSKEPR